MMNLSEELEEEELPPSPEGVEQHHPLMIEDILDKIFPYFTGDAKNLTSFRLVNHAWNNSACRTIKESLRWKIGGPSPERNEAAFVQLMSNCTADVLKNFDITLSKAKAGPTSSIRALQQRLDEDVSATPEFITNYGPCIVDLRLHGFSSRLISSYLKPELLPNLTTLKLYGLIESVLAKSTLLSELEKKFPNLHSISFHRDPLSIFYNGVQEDSNICINLLTATPAFTELGINLQKICTLLLLASPPHLLAQLSNLTRFNTLSPPNVVLNSVELKNLVGHCQSLKKLGLAVDVEIPEFEIYNELAKLSYGLEELNLELAKSVRIQRRQHVRFSSSSSDDSDASSSTSSDDDDDPHFMDVYDTDGVAFPIFPVLKKLVLVNVHLYNNFDAFNNMPALTHIDVQLKSFDWPTSHPSHEHDNVQYLKVRWANNPPFGFKLTYVTAFSALTELDICVGTDSDLRVIFEYMVGLKKLHLNRSRISDAGMTGVVGVDSKNPAHFINWEVKVHDFPYIGNLVDLQHFTFAGQGLSHLSVDHGIVDCKDLRFLKIPPYVERQREGYYAQPPYNNYYEDAPVGSLRAQIIPILQNCPRLLKFDIRMDWSDQKWSTSYRMHTLKFPRTKQVIQADLEFIKGQGGSPNYIEILHD